MRVIEDVGSIEGRAGELSEQLEATKRQLEETQHSMSAEIATLSAAKADLENHLAQLREEMASAAHAAEARHSQIVAEKAEVFPRDRLNRFRQTLVFTPESGSCAIGHGSSRTHPAAMSSSTSLSSPSSRPAFRSAMISSSHLSKS